MKTLAICGSPRKGNTEKMLNIVLNKVDDKELILLREKNIEHCGGCNECQKEPYECVIDDDMKEINDKLKEAGIVVFGSPTYFDNVSGLFKDFIDRTHPLYPIDGLKNKKAIVCAVGGGDITTVKKAADAIRYFCEAQGMNVVDEICVTNDNIKGNEEKLKQIGQKLEE